MQRKAVPGPSGARTRLQRRAARALALLAVLVALHLWSTRHAAQGRAPPLQGSLLSGRSFDLQRRTDGPVLVYFWATWCRICRLSEGSIDGVARDWQVVTVALRSGGAAEVQAFMTERGLGYPVLIDPDGAIAAGWGVEGVPTSFVVDRRGVIRFVAVGYTSGVGLRVRLRLAAGADSVFADHPLVARGEQ